MEIRTCVNCGQRVGVTALGICPACRRPVDTAETPASGEFCASVPTFISEQQAQIADLQRLRARLFWPAGALLVLSILALAVDTVMVGYLFVVNWQNEGWSGAFLSLAVNGATVLTNVITLYGAVCMLRLKSFSSARAGAFLSMLPFFTPLFILGIPFGIWAFVLIYDSRLRAAFDSPNEKGQRCAELQLP